MKSKANILAEYAADKIREFHAGGKTLTNSAKFLGVSVGVLAQAAAKLGIDFSDNLGKRAGGTTQREIILKNEAQIRQWIEEGKTANQCAALLNLEPGVLRSICHVWGVKFKRAWDSQFDE